MMAVMQVSAQHGQDQLGAIGHLFAQVYGAELRNENFAGLGAGNRSHRRLGWLQHEALLSFHRIDRVFLRLAIDAKIVKVRSHYEKL